jgi:hypothetical protein
MLPVDNAVFISIYFELIHPPDLGQGGHSNLLPKGSDIGLPFPGLLGCG